MFLALTVLPETKEHGYPDKLPTYEPSGDSMQWNNYCLTATDVDECHYFFHRDSLKAVRAEQWWWCSVRLEVSGGASEANHKTAAGASQASPMMQIKLLEEHRSADRWSEWVSAAHRQMLTRVLAIDEATNDLCVVWDGWESVAGEEGGREMKENKDRQTHLLVQSLLPGEATLAPSPIKPRPSQCI